MSPLVTKPTSAKRCFRVRGTHDLETRQIFFNVSCSSHTYTMNRRRRPIASPFPWINYASHTAGKWVFDTLAIGRRPYSNGSTEVIIPKWSVTYCPFRIFNPIPNVLISFTENLLRFCQYKILSLLQGCLPPLPG